MSRRSRKCLCRAAAVLLALAGSAAPAMSQPSPPSKAGVFEGTCGLEVRGTGTAANEGYGAIFVSEDYRGLWAGSLTGYYAGYFESAAGIYSSGGYSTKKAQRTLAVNGSTEILEVGQVVALAGVVEAPDGRGHLLAVRKADEASGSSTIGVVVQAIEGEVVDRGPRYGGVTLSINPREGDIYPYGFLMIVTHGLAPAVRMEALPEDLQIGDLVTASGTAGSATRVKPKGNEYLPILGKIAGLPDLVSGTVPVFVLPR